MIANQELANQIVLIMTTMIELSEEMKQLLEKNQIDKFKDEANDLYAAIKAIEKFASTLKAEEEALNLPAALKSVEISLHRIVSFINYDHNIEKSLNKIEFELIPLIEEMRVYFYFWAMVYPDKEKIKKYLSDDMYKFRWNRYVEHAMETGIYKYDISIIVLGYNKKSLTQVCLQNLYKNLPKELSYEIILVNHGSDDGTKELFESYHPNKQMDIAVNGGGFGASYRITEGKYIVVISNDVVVTKNALENLYKCIESDEKIAWVVPTTPNISNLQTIPVQYSSFEEMVQFAEQNNISDFTRWEQRVRICNPIDIERAEFLLKTRARHIFHGKREMSFTDDKLSLICRRNGYKIYLAKDAFCHHFGSMTLKEDAKTNSQIAFQKGRNEFIEMFNIDPWAPSCCYDYNLFSKLNIENKETIKILGIECGMGSNPLKIKEIIKEKFANKKCYITNIISDATFFDDIKGVSDQAYLLKTNQDMEQIEEKFDYIVNEYVIKNVKEFESEIKLCEKLCVKDGTIIVLIVRDLIRYVEKKVDNIEIINTSNYRNGIQKCAWLVFKNGVF